MIGKLTGTVDSVGPDWVILDVGGVGYVVHCSARTLQRLPKAGETARLSIETHVREDRIQLFGFMADLEREWFRLLNTVQGVGTKVALGVLSVMDASDLATTIALQDKAAIARAPGVGPKVAMRIAAELKDRAPLFADVDPALARFAGEVAEARGPQPARDAVSALVNLGYAAPQASGAIAAALKTAGDGATTEQLIRGGLKELAKGGSASGEHAPIDVGERKLEAERIELDQAVEALKQPQARPDAALPVENLDHGAVTGDQNVMPKRGEALVDMPFLEPVTRLGAGGHHLEHDDRGVRRRRPRRKIAAHDHHVGKRGGLELGLLHEEGFGEDLAARAGRVEPVAEMARDVLHDARVLPTRSDHHPYDAPADQLPLLVRRLVGEQLLEVVEGHVLVSRRLGAEGHGRVS